MKYGISLALIILVIVAGIVEYKKKKRSDSVQNQLVSLLQHGRYSEFDVQVKDAYEKGFLNSFNRNYMRMNRYMMSNDKKNVDLIVKEFAVKDLKNVQKASVFSNAMIYYVSVSDYQMCAFCYREIQKLKANEDLKETAGLVYRILVEKKKDDLETVEKRIKTATGPQKQFYEKLKREILKSE